jgi:hypothetical protein
MGRKKTQLLARDQYARLIAALRCAELVRAHATGRGPVELRLEDSRFSPWDDLTELHRDESGRSTWHVWQVKRQRGPLAQQKLRPLLKKLGERPELIAHLAIYQPVSVRGLGSLNDLDEICQRVRKRGFDPAAEPEWSQDETKWLKYVRALLGSQEAALALLRRLHIDVYGSEAQLREDTEVRLERYFVAPTKVLERLLAFIADNTDQAVRYDNALLEDLLRDFERHPNLGAVPLVELRKVYLSAVVEVHGKLSPLRLLSGLGIPSGSGPRLAEIFAMPAIRLAADVDEPLRIPRKSKLKGNVATPVDEEESPLPRLERELTRTDDLRLAELLLDPSRLAERPLFLVEGSVGAGKSTLLEHLLFRLAEHAVQDSEAPLPLRIEARRLADGLKEAVVQGTPRFNPQLLHTHAPGFVYLVDGLDEVERGRAPAVQACLEELSHQPATRAMVMVGRPSTTHVEVPSGTVRLRIAPWSRAQIEDFLDKWRKHDPGSVEAVSRWARTEALLPVLSSPLTATFALLLAREEPESLMNRAMLFRGVVEKLFSDWARHRKPHDGTPPLSWATIAPSFRQLALESLKEGKEDLKLADLRKHLGRRALDHELEWVDEAHRRFGLLMYQEDGRYRFLLKGIAEHLAGAELLARGQDEILQAARKKWGEEPIRHALGLGLEREGVAWVTDMIRKLLPGPAGVQVQEVRPLLVAAQVGLDLGDAGAPLAEPIAEALFKLLTLETSVWLQNEVGEAVRELARLGGPCWDALLRKLAPTLQARGAPAQWYAAQANRDKDWWLEALKHRDLDVRRIAVERLTPWVNDPQVREALIQQLGDSSYSPFSEPPVLRAGLALRGAARDENFQRLLPSLVMQARRGGQILGGAAVLALRPGEAPTRLLADRLQHLHMGLWKYPEVLRELTRSPEAEAEIEAVWQGWRSDLDKPPQLPEGTIEPLDGPIVPLSQQTRRQVMRAIGPAIAQWPPERWQQFSLSFDDRTLTLALCEAAWDHPEGILTWLKDSKASWLTPDAELLLGEAAVRHPALRSALLDRWESRQSEHERSLFPGGALASFIARDDRKAAEIYAQWLRVTAWLRTGFESVFLSPTALRHPLVHPVAVEKALDTWKQFSEGEIKDGKRTTLSGGVMASILGALRPAWEDSTPLMQKLIHLAREGDGDDLTHALEVFSKPPYPRELGDILVERFEELAAETGADHRGHVGFWIDWAQRASIADRMQAALEKVRAWRSWHHYPAALALIAIDPRQAGRLSQEAARNWPDDWDLFFLRPSMLARLVRANVSAWYHQWLEVMSADALPIWSVFRLARILAPLLDATHRADLNRKLGNRLGTLETYWIQDGENPWDCVSLADLYSRLLFETSA